jgi:hypothetical protein
LLFHKECENSHTLFHFKEIFFIYRFTLFSISLFLYFFSFSILAENIEEIPLDVRNNYVPTFLHLEPQAVSPNTLPKGKSSFTSGYSLANDIKESNLYVEKNIPFAYQRPILYEYYQRKYPDNRQAYAAADYSRFGRLENQYRTSIDLESSYLMLRYNYGITSRLELGIQISVLSFNSGILDAGINSYHSIIGTFTGKELVPNNKYKYTVTGENGVLLSTPPRTGLGDSTLSAKWNLKSSEENGLSFALLGLVKVPTGASRYEMSSGKLDGGVGLALKYKRNKIIGYLNGYAIGISNSFSDSGIHLRSYVASTFTLEYLFVPKLSILSQLDLRSSAYGSHTPYLSRPPVLLSFGVNWKVRKSSILQLSFTEDLTITVPDITVQILWKESL